MNEQSRRWAIAALVLLFAAATTAGAMMANLPAEQRQGSIAFLSGGIGEDQQAAIEQAAPNYALELEFVKAANRAREFLAGVQVDITDSTHHTVLSTTSDGPFLLVKLPSGTYSVKATNAGSTQSRSVTVVAGKHQKMLFDWK